MTSSRKKIGIVVIVGAAVIVILAIAFARHYQKRHEMLKVDLVSIKTAGGWGYEIKVDSKPFIHQEFIPAIPGKISFSTEADALKTGNLVVKKLVHGQLPSLSKEEVLALGLDTNASVRQ